jgi:uncharacterized protein (DUF1697 family)
MGTRQVALLRGVNVGRARRIAMPDLRTLVEGLGYRDVVTLLNSGNVVFTARGSDAGGIGRRIEKALASRLGVDASVFMLSAAELAVAIAENPLGRIAHDPSRFLIGVTANAAGHAKFRSLTNQTWAPEALAVGERVAYLWCAEGIIASRLMQAVNRALGDGITARNWATMTKLLALAQENA